MDAHLKGYHMIRLPISKPPPWCSKGKDGNSSPSARCSFRYLAFRACNTCYGGMDYLASLSRWTTKRNQKWYLRLTELIMILFLNSTWPVGLGVSWSFSSSHIIVALVQNYAT